HVHGFVAAVTGEHHRGLDDPATTLGLLLLTSGLGRHIAGLRSRPRRLAANECRLRVLPATRARLSAVSATRVLHHVGPEPLESTRAAFPDVEFVPVPVEGELGDDIHGDVLLTTAIGGPNLPEVLARGARWVDTIGTGLGGLPAGDGRPD